MLNSGSATPSTPAEHPRQIDHDDKDAVSPIPLTEELRNELDETILANLGLMAKFMLVPDPNMTIELSAPVLKGTIEDAISLLLRENLKVVLKNDTLTGLKQILVQRPELRDIVRAACEAGNSPTSSVKGQIHFCCGI